ncbi:EAL domain-containing protein [Cohnella boryungensis]|uniref:EAL domain-containing protein n=1 Tax=Cohnella boryungensis TaxID=768479 RepID=A0ABV8SI45_9BACL
MQDWKLSAIVGLLAAFVAVSLGMGRRYWLNLRRFAAPKTEPGQDPGLHSLKRFKKLLRHKVREGIPFSLTLLYVNGYRPMSSLNEDHSALEMRKQFSRRLTNWAPEDSLLCQLDHRHFLVCIPESAGQRTTSASMWEDMKEQLSAPYRVEGQRYPVTLRTSRVTGQGKRHDIDQLIADARTALQHGGEDDVQNDTEQENQQAVAMLRQQRIQIDLRAALADNQLGLHYQPQYELNSGKLRGFEALLRWNHPELGKVMPLEVIPIAEQLGIVAQLGEWVLLQSCRTLLQVAPSPSRLTISVNISGMQMMDESFPERLQAILRDTGISPERLELEVKEAALSGRIETAEKQLMKLRALGVRLALDDFGACSSSMLYVRKLPFQIIKIDHKAKPATQYEEQSEVWGPMIRFMKKHEYGIIAKGLETYEQLAYLKKCQCDYGQGFLLSHPLSCEELPPLIHSV